MAGLRAKLPPVNSLLVFEAAARHLNFTRAAQELSVTQAAVSRQIQIIEEHLGTLLFHRMPRALKLTPAGTHLSKSVTMGLEHIASTVTDIRRVGSKADVTIATSVTFASYWLMAHIAKFRALNPDIELKVVASAPVSNLAAAGIDLAVRYGTGAWPGVEVIHLLDNAIFPVCAPSYLQGRKPLRTARDLLGEVLLHLVEYDRNWVTWEAWLNHFDVPWKPTKKGLEFDNYLVLIQAAIDGQGIALGGQRLAEDFISRGALVRPIEATLSSTRGFYLLFPVDVPLSKPAKLFRDWIVAETKGPMQRVATNGK
jgi:LysR family transcriptional regulator, glycine cleavage system transcriptional activator